MWFTKLLEWWDSVHHIDNCQVLILDGDTCVHALLQGGLCDSEHMWFQQGSPWTEQTESNISYSDSKTFPKIM